MKEILEFIKVNWQLIVAVLVFILSFILQLIKKKPVTDIISFIYEACLIAINLTEKDDINSNGQIKGENKLNRCIKRVQQTLIYKFPDINVGKYVSLIECCIESILGTPQKKG